MYLLRTLGLVFLAFLVSLTLFTTKGKTIPIVSEDRPELVLQLGHSQGVTCAAFAPDGTWVASGASDNLILIWQLPSGRHLRTLTGHNGPIRSLAISANGEWLASGSNDRTIKVWRIAKGTQTFTLTGHTGSINSLAFSPSGEWLVSGSSDKSIRIWNPATGKQLESVNNQPDEVNVLTFSKNGEFFASSAGKEIRLWDVKKLKDPRTLRRHSAVVTAIAFSHDGNSIASGSADGTVLVWRRGSDREQFALKSNSSSVLALSFGLEGSLSSVHSDGGLESWDTSNGQKKSTLAGDSNAQATVFASFSSDASMLAFGVGKRELSLRSTTSGNLIGTLETHVTGINSVAFSSDGRWFAAAANDSSIRLWHVTTGRELPRLSGHMGYVNTVAFSPDNQFLASGSNSGVIKVWDISTAQAYSLPRQAGSVNIVNFSPDGKFLAAGGIDNKIEIWELESKRVRFLTGHSEEITSLVFIESGNKLISGSRDKTVRVWNVNSGEAISSFDNLAAEVNALSVSPDGQLLAAANVDKTVRLWKISDPVPIKTFTGHAGQVWTVVFNPSSTMLASGSDDRNVILWDLQSGKDGPQLKGNSDSVSGLAFTKDGRFIACGSDDGSITVWDSASAELKATMVSMPNSDDWLVATPDGLFDGSPESWNLMLWRFDGSTFNVLPVESFFNEFYYPGVLAEILASKDPKAPSNIVQKDRRQPRIDLKIRNGNSDVTTRNIDIEIEVAGVPADKSHSTESGAKDLRLFRNGLLVKKWAGDVLQTGNTRTLRTTIRIVAGENRISAYAFNSDNIKSLDATAIVNGANNLTRKGAAHMLVIGIEQYENPRYNLKYSVSDATEMGAQLKAQQERLGRYNPIVTIPLTNAEATKKNILLALARLAGSSTGPLPQDVPKVISTINPAQPEDAVVIYFSGHGSALRDRFYLIPHDMGKGNQLVRDVAGLTAIINHSISDEELVDSLQPLEADQLLVVIDACYSGQALESDEKRRGPMNTRGLAQLAYEKGIYVLTASESMEVAFEADALKHSYLAYALLEEGLKKRAADANRDGDIFLKEWFDYANQRVPEIRRMRQRGRKELVEVERDEQNVQRPRVFYTREMGAKQFLIAR